MKLVNVLSICLLFTFVFSVSTCSTADHRKVYNVYMGSLPEGEYSPTLHHSEIINQVIDSSFASRSLIRSYKRSFNGFTAYLSQEEWAKMASFNGVVSVFPCKTLQLQAARSWDYMGFPSIVERRPSTESDIIVGVIGRGIWRESESFHDDPIAIGAYRSMEKGILRGTSINAFRPSSEEEPPLVYGEEVTNSCTETDAKNCYKGCVEAVTAAGALGCIVPNGGKKISEVMPLPDADVRENDFNLVINYKTSTKNPEVKIFKSEVIRNPAAPLVASSSSRGPSMLMHDILKVNDSNRGTK